MLFILDRQEKIVATLKNGGANEASPFFDDVLTEDLATGAETFQFSTASNYEISKELVIGNYVAFMKNGKYKLFQIMQTEEVHDEFMYFNVYCECAGLELINKVFRGREIASADLKKFLTTVLEDTGWSVGHIEATSNGAFSFELPDESVYATLQNNLSKFDVEMEFRVEINNGRISRKYIDTYYKRGKVTGKRFEFGKDIEQISRKVNSTELYTALIGKGAKDISFRDITVSGIDKPLGQDFVADQESFERYNNNGHHLMGVYYFETSSPQELLRQTYKKLKEVCTPQVEYEVKVALLGELLGEDWNRVTIGDTVYIIDNFFNPALQLAARVVKLETSFTDPEKDTCTLANFIPIKSNITEEMRKLASQLEGYVENSVSNKFPISGEDIQEGAIDGSHLNQSIITTDHLIAGSVTADKIHTDFIRALDGKFDTLEVKHGEFQELVAQKAEIIDAKIENLKVEHGEFQELVAQKADIFEADIIGLKAETAEIGEAVIENAEISNAKIEKLESDYAEIDRLVSEKAEIIEAEIGTLKANDATLNNAIIQNAEITNTVIQNAEITNAKVENLVAKTGNIENLVSGNITADNISTDLLTVIQGWLQEASIGDAQISSVNANKIKAGEIDTSLVSVVSKDGAIEITGNQILINDTSNPLKKVNRIILGKVRKDDGTIDYSLLIRGKDGKTVMFDSETGITNAGITSGAIEDNAISDEANISGYKLDINSVIREVNETGTVTISGTKVQVGNKTLNVELSEQKNILNEHGETLTSHGSKIEANEREISLKVSEQIYNENLKTQNAEIKAMKDLIELGIGEVEVTEKLVKLETDIKEYANTQINQAKADIKITTDGITQNVSNVTKTTETLRTDLSAAKELAESKAKVFTSTPVPPYKVGDLWVTGSNGDFMKCKTARTTGSYNANDWEKATKYTDDTKANQVAGELDITKNKVSTNESSINILKDQISSKVSQTDVDRTVANIQVGGRNLIKNSKDLHNSKYNFLGNSNIRETVTITSPYGNSDTATKLTISSSTNNNIFRLSNTVDENGTYTFSCWYKSANSSNHGIHFDICDKTFTNQDRIAGQSWEKVEITSTVNNFGTAYNFVDIEVSPGGSILIYNPQLERGNKATDWTPAPEDTDKLIADNIKVVTDKITNVSSELNQTKDSITASVSSLTTKTNTIESNLNNTTRDLTGKINTAKTEAINTASSDATTKANNALNNAKTYTNTQITTVNDKVASAKSDISVLQGQIATKVSQSDIDNSISKIQFGGRNLIRKNNISTYKSTLVSFDEATNTYTLQIANGADNTWGAGIALTGSNILIPYGRNYICSFEVLVPVDCNWNVDHNFYPVSGSSWNSNDNDDTPKRATSSKSLKANVWTKCWFKAVNTHASNTNKVDLKDCSNFGIINNTGNTMTFKIRNIKGELATTPSEWTPAPEDVNKTITDNIEVVNRKISDVSSELNQTKNSITARISSAETNINKLSDGSNQNLLYNADFAIMNGNIPDGWIVNSGITFDKNTTLLDGIGSFFFNITGLTENKWYAVYSPMVAANKGQKFTVSAYVRGLENWSATDSSVSIEIEYFNSSGGRIGTSSSSADKSKTDWQRIKVTGTCPEGTVNVRLRVHPVRNGKFNMSKPMLQVGEVVTGWQKGFNIQDVTSRLKNAESKITDEAITNTVKSNFYTKTETENQITSKGYQTSSQVQQTVDALQLKFQQSGGYNLIRNSSGASYNTNSWTTNATLGVGANDSIGSSCRSFLYLDNGTNTGERYAFSSRFKLKPNTKYTFTGYFHNYTKCPHFDVFILSSTSVDDTDKGTSYTNAQQIINAQNTNGTWKKFVCKFTTPANVKSGIIRIDNNGYNSSGTNDNRVHWNTLMLTEGDIEMPWSPHPSEIYDGITTIDKDGVTVTASNVKSRTRMSADGFRITKTDNNEDVFKVNADGTLYMKGNVTLTSGSVPTNILTGTIGKDKIHGTILADINQALSDSSSAIGKINTANSEISATKSKVSTLESNFTTMQGQISSKVSQSDVDRTVANIQVGGRNLILNSNVEKTLLSPATSYQQIDYVSIAENAGKAVNVIKTYTLSVWLTKNKDKSIPFSSIVVGKGEGDSWSYRIYPSECNITQLTDDILLYTKTFIIDGSKGHYINSFVKFICESRDSAGSTVLKIKLEEGNKATDWTPAPEDTDKLIADNIKVVTDKITNVSSELNQTKDSITASVSSLTTKTTTIETNLNNTTKDLTGKINTAKTEAINTASSDATTKANNALNNAKSYTNTQITEAKAAIKITTDNISSEVSKKVNSNQIISSINQTAESVKIKANKIQLDGSTTIGDNEKNHIEIDKANYSVYRGDRKVGYFGMVADEKNGHPKLTLGHNGIRVENDDYLTLHAYGGGGNNAEGNSSAYCDFAYHSIKFKDWSNIKMYGNGDIKLAPIKDLIISTNYSDGSYGDQGENKVAMFAGSTSQYYKGNLQIGAVRNMTNSYGLVLTDDHADNKCAVRVNVDSNGSRFFRPLTTDGNIELGSGGYKWKKVHSVNGVSYSVIDNSLEPAAMCMMDNSIDTALDTLNFSMNFQRGHNKRSTDEIQLELDISQLKDHELSNMFLNITEEECEDGEILTSTSADMTSLLHLALYELQKQKKEIKLLKEQIAAIKK